MTEQERADLSELRDLFAGIALPGVIAKRATSVFNSYIDIAEDCYNIAEAMMRERVKRINQDNLINEKHNECKSNN